MMEPGFSTSTFEDEYRIIKQGTDKAQAYTPYLIANFPEQFVKLPPCHGGSGPITASRGVVLGATHLAGASCRVLGVMRLPVGAVGIALI